MLTTLDTKLVSAVVYPDRARLTRTGKTSLDTGLHILEIANLPLEMRTESLRASARGSARAKLRGVQAKRTFFTEAPVEQVRQLESDMEAKKDELQSIETQIELVRQSRSNLNSLAGRTDTFALALASGEMSVESHRKLYDDLRSQMEILDSEMLKLGGRKRELERHIEKLKNELKELTSARPRKRYSAQVEIDVLEAGDLTLELIYVVNGADWKPLYDLRLTEEASLPALELNYLAEISQISGEDWETVSLLLSTARPALTNTLPDLDPWYIRQYTPPAPMPRVAAAAMTRSLSDKAVAAPPSEETAAMLNEAAFTSAEYEQAQVETSSIALSYLVPGVFTIPGDGQPHKVNVAVIGLVPKMDYVCAPRLVEEVYRRAKITNDSPYTLLAGAGNLFAGDEFIGATTLEFTAPQGEIEMYFGVEDQIKVEREIKRRDVEKTLIGGKRRWHFGYEIRLENLLETFAHLTIHDQIPVAGHEEIKVRLESADPKPNQQSELNLLDWNLDLEPREKRTLRFDFMVEYPAVMEVRGLP